MRPMSRGQCGRSSQSRRARRYAHMTPCLKSGAVQLAIADLAAQADEGLLDQQRTVRHPRRCGEKGSRSQNVEDRSGRFILIMLLVVYFVPAIIATLRHLRNRTAILVLNVLLGWTFIGWVVALVYALTGDVEPREYG